MAEQKIAHPTFVKFERTEYEGKKLVTVTVRADSPNGGLTPGPQVSALIPQDEFEDVLTAYLS